MRNKSFISVMVVAAVMLMCGCRSSQPMTVATVEKVVTRVDTFLKRDSVFQRDSVWVTVKGDTVTVDRWHWRTRTEWMYEMKTDTMIIRDTVRIERGRKVGDDGATRCATQTGKVSWWMKVQYGMDGAVIGWIVLLLGWVGWKVYRYIKG